MQPQIPQNWPDRSASRFVACPPHIWHVQDVGQGPILLMIHGAGGAGQSWRGLTPLLRDQYRVITVDLPGQGFTRLGARHRCGLDAMAQDLNLLMQQEGWQPMAYVGHSAGAAIALRLAELTPPAGVIGINAALGQFQGVAGWLFPAMARLLSAAPLVAQIFSRMAGNPTRVAGLLDSTGSKIDAQGRALYLQLLRMPTHVDATLAMMAQWTLDGLMLRLGQQATPCLLITASQDRAVPPAVSTRAVARLPAAQWCDIPGFGHLVHEEAPHMVAAPILQFLSTLSPVAVAGRRNARP